VRRTEMLAWGLLDETLQLRNRPTGLQSTHFIYHLNFPVSIRERSSPDIYLGQAKVCCGAKKRTSVKVSVWRVGLVRLGPCQWKSAGLRSDMAPVGSIFALLVKGGR